MKIEFKKPEFNKLRKAAKGNEQPSSEAAAFGVPGFTSGDEDSGFGVNVRNEEVGIKLLDGRSESPWWLRELPHELATALALTALPAMILAAAGMASTIPFLLAGAAVYMIMTSLSEIFEDRIKYLTAIGIFIALAAAAVILRKYLWGGIGTIMNSVFDSSESVQAYLYDRIGVGSAADEHPELCIRLAAAWTSTLIGMIAALPASAVRRAIGIGMAIAAMLSMAYYGIIPPVALLAIVAAVLLFVLSRGGIPAALPVLLISLLLFGGVMLINPGENYGISRADENIRDRLAFKSAYLKSDLEQETPDNLEQELKDNQDSTENNFSNFTSEHKGLTAAIIAALLLAAIGAIVYFLYKRYKKRRDEIRAGIDSEDARTAIVAMFPYAVRWLGAADLDVHDRSFASLIEPLKHDVSDQYSSYFRSMYVMWREAAYSDHEMNEEKRDSMREFLDETRDMVRRDLDFKGKVRAALKYAL